jgi:preprotein translocase subunit Sss1
MMELAPDFDEFIGSLTAHGVEFLVVGALEPGRDQ